MAKPSINSETQVPALITAFNQLSNNVGDPAALNTTATSDLVAAINSIYALIDTDQDFRNKISVTDAGGDGSLSYNSTTGVITYTGPSASEVRAHFSAGTGISITNGVVAGVNASTTVKGVASFNSNFFSTASGVVSLADLGVTEAKVADDAISAAKLKNVVTFEIVDKDGNVIQTLYGAGS